MSWLVIDEGAFASGTPGEPALTPPPLQWSLVACIPAATFIGPPICTNQIDPCDGCEGKPPEDPLAFPVVQFQVPTEADLEARGASSVLVQGAICANGPPASEDVILRFILGETDDLDPCEDPDNEGRFVTAEIPIERDPANPNLNPEILSVTYDGRAWPPPYDQGVPRTAPRTGCLDELETLPEEVRNQHPIAGSQGETINLAVTSESLQTFTVDNVEDIEEIQVSWLSDGGDFERTFSFISDPDFPSVLTAWRPLPVNEEDGLLVRFNFVVRDGRGGVSFVERGLCVRPPAGE